MSAEARLPEYLRFVWMFFLRPVSLHRRLKACGIEEPGAPGWRVWRDLAGAPALRRGYLGRLVTTLALTVPVVGAVVWCLESLGFHLNWGHVTVSIAVSVAVSVAVTVPVVAGVLALGVAVGPSEAMVFSVGISMVLGVVVGVVASVAFGVTFSVAYIVRTGLAVGVVCGLVVGMALSMAAGALVGLASGMSFSLAFLRLPFYPVEALHQTLIYWQQKLIGTLTLGRSPVLWHELSYLPLPFLGRHIEITAARDVRLTKQALAACDITPGQRQIGRGAMARIQNRELERIGREGRFLALVTGEMEWMRPNEEVSADSPALHRVARYVLAAGAANAPVQRLDHLQRAQKDLDGLEATLLARGSARQGLERAVLVAWQRTIARLRSEAERDAADSLANPFRAGDPLEPDLGQEVFRGRDDVFRRIERLLVDPVRNASIALLAPRRCGKTSVLKMLPALVPDAVCIFFDLQEHPVDTPAAFFQSLDHETRVQARRDRGLELPALSDGTPFEAAGRWLDALEAAAGDRRLLFCLDEFETLERTFPGSPQDLLKLMGLFRSIIQHRRAVRILVSGEAPFDELDAMWNDHFISVREVRFGHLDAATARDLVRKPTSDFPGETLPEDVAARIVERTGGQPYLVQLYAQLAVELLNDEDRRRATLEDLETVEGQVLEEAGYYFRNSWQRGPDSAREALAALARGATPELDRPARRWLRRRELIDEEGRLTIPVLGRFLIEAELA